MKLWQALGLGLGAGLLAGLAARGRGLGAVRNPADVHPAIVPQIDDAERRARAAGATGELEYIGAGGEGIVFCDTRGKAFKVGRGTRGDGGMQDEAEWFAMASKIPNIKQHVPKFFRYDPEHDVIVRECVAPKPDARNRPPRKLWELHHRLASVMATYGYGRPEFKNDSWVLTKRGPVLVDAGFAIRSGHPLVRDTLDVLNGRKRVANKYQITQLGFDLRHERGKTIPPLVANKLLKRLQAIEPSVEL